MQESPSSKPAYLQNLEVLKARWDALKPIQRTSAIINLYQNASATGISEKIFLEEADRIFTSVTVQTLIHLWVNSFNMPGGDKLVEKLYGASSENDGGADAKPNSTAEHTDDKADMTDTLAQTRASLEKALDEQPVIPPTKPATADNADAPDDSDGKATDKRYRKTGRKPKERPDITTIKALIGAKKPDRFLPEDIELIKRCIEKEWKQLKHTERVLIIKKLLQTETGSDKITKDTITVLSSTLPFIPIEYIAGYAEISDNPKTFKWWCEQGMLDGKGIKIIGEIRLEFDVDLTDFTDDLRSLGSTKANSAESGIIKSSAFKQFKDVVSQSITRVNQITIGTEYVIDTESPYAEAYSGYMDDKFKYEDQTQEKFDNLRERARTKFHGFFVGDGGKIFVIDKRAVCPAPEKKKD